jgi:hypothetical protein
MERGVAIMEATIGIVTLMLLLTLGISIVDFTDYTDLSQEVADRALLETNLKPLSLAIGVDGAPRVVTNDQALLQFVATLTQKAETALRGKLTELSNPNAPYFIEARYGVVRHNPTTGAFTGVIDLPAAGRSTRGSLPLAASLDSLTSLTTRFQNMASTVVPHAPNLLAIPSGALGTNPTETTQYLDRSVVVGIRVVTALSPSFTAEALGGNSKSLGVKAIVLRGGLSDAQ